LTRTATTATGAGYSSLCAAASKTSTIARATAGRDCSTATTTVAIICATGRRANAGTTAISTATSRQSKRSRIIALPSIRVSASATRSNHNAVILHCDRRYSHDYTTSATTTCTTACVVSAASAATDD